MEVVNTKPILGVGPTGNVPERTRQPKIPCGRRLASNTLAMVWMRTLGETGSDQRSKVPIGTVNVWRTARVSSAVAVKRQEASVNDKPPRVPVRLEPSASYTTSAWLAWGAPSSRALAASEARGMQREVRIEGRT
jgi:hypothetical protein